VKKVVIGNCILYNGDCLEVLEKLSSEQIHSCVTDPPYHLTSIVKRFGGKNAAPAKSNGTGVYARSSAGFMGQTWDGGDIAFRPETWEKVINALKPGGHLCAFSGTRTYHRMAVAIEDAGFEIRDMIAWLYGSGFPKSHNLAVGITKKLDPTWKTGDQMMPESAAWEGWGTAIKPAQEPITLARKPLSEKTVAANVLRHGTGAINIDDSRVGYGEKGPDRPFSQTVNTEAAHWGNSKADDLQKYKSKGRWPANVVHDGSDEVLEGFPNSKSCNSPSKAKKTYGCGLDESGGSIFGGTRSQGTIYPGDSGSAARFYYCAKTSKKERGEDNNHPTVKPIALMEWLVKLVTPKGGVVLDPFMGSGSTGLACVKNGFKFIGIEKDPKYFDIACKRIESAVNENKSTTTLDTFIKTREQHVNE